MSNDLFSLNGHTVIITGGVGLLGREYALAIAQAGANVVVADLNQAAADQVAAEATAQSGNKAIGVGVDVSNKDSVLAMVEKTIETFGRVDGLINNAAINPKFDAGEAEKHVFDFENYPLELWQQSLNVNVTGMFLCAQAVAPVMLKQGRGVIVNVSSTYGLNGPDQRLYEPDDPDEPVSYKPVDYSVTKSAVLGLTRYLAAYWGRKGIRVNTFTPGGVYNNQDDAFVARYSYRTPMGRMADRADYCGAMIYLLSDASRYMTGANLINDGGWTAW